MRAVKHSLIICGVLVVIVLAALISRSDRGAYHLREFENVRTNFNNYQPSLPDRLRGITNNEAKWKYHLRQLEALGVVIHTNLVFTMVPYTGESSRRLFRSAYSNFPAAVIFSGKYYASNAPEYNVRPYALEVWDFPTNMRRWSLFLQSENHQ